MFKDSSWLHIHALATQTLLSQIIYKSEDGEWLPQIRHPNKLFKDSMKRKQHRTRFEVGKPRRAIKQLQLMHTHIVGPLKVTSLAGYRCFITFISDFSRKTQVYFLKENLEALDKCKKFRAMSEKQNSCSNKVLRSGRGGECTSDDFDGICKDVWHHTTTNSSLQVAIEHSAWEEECDNSKYGEKHAEDKVPAKKLLH